MFLSCDIYERSKPFSKILHWLLESVPDSAYVAGTKFPCALIEDNCELHFVTSLELQTVLYFFHMEEQFLAFANFICDEAKLQRRKQIQRKEDPTWQIPCKQTISTWSLTHSTKALRWGTRIHAIFCPVWATVQTWNFTGSPFWRQSALLAILMIPKGIFWPLLPPETKQKHRQNDCYLPRAVNNIFPSALRHRPSSMTSISPWYSDWEGSTLRKGRMTFPVITVASISSPRAFTASGKALS